MALTKAETARERHEIDRTMIPVLDRSGSMMARILFNGRVAIAVGTPSSAHSITISIPEFLSWTNEVTDRIAAHARANQSISALVEEAK